MKTNGVEDILIGESYKSTKKSKISGIIIFFILVIIICISIYVIYKYYFKPDTSNKDNFFNSISTIKLNNITNENVYSSMIKKFFTTDSEVNSSITLNGSKVTNSALNNVDLSNFSIDINNKNDLTEKKQYASFDVRYLENDFFNFKYILDEDKINWKSDEVVSMYIESNLDNLKNDFGINYDKDIVNNLVNSETTDLSRDDCIGYSSDTINLVKNSITEDKFSVQSNFAIKKDDKTVDVEAYTLNLSQEDFNEIMVKVLTELKNNKTLLEKVTLEKSENNSEDENANIVTNTVPLIDVKTTTSDENINNNENNEEQENQNVDDGQEQELENNDENIESSETTEETQLNAEEINQNASNEINLNEINIEQIENEFINNDFLYLICGKKLNYSYDEIVEKLDDLINQFSKMKGNGFKVTIYKSQDGIEKITTTFPNSNSLDILFENGLVDTENKLSINYLFKGNNSNLFNLENKNLEITASDNTVINDDDINISNEINGYTFDIDTQYTSAFSKLVCNVSFIENNTINKKINFDINTEGGVTSKKYDQNVIVSIMTSDNENKIVLDNTIEFKDVEIETLNDTTRFSLETLSAEDKMANVQAIKDRFNVVYNEKIDAINFINTTTNTATMQDVSSTITVEEAKNALTNKIALMRQEASDNNTEFSIANLEGLTIDGIKVSSQIGDNVATIVVDVYTFTVDSEFNITEN